MGASSPSACRNSPTTTGSPNETACWPSAPAGFLGALDHVDMIDPGGIDRVDVHIEAVDALNLSRPLAPLADESFDAACVIADD